MEPMKSRPILFSGPMVRALLDGSKTQTRRIVKSSAKEHMDNIQGILTHAVDIVPHTGGMMIHGDNPTNYDGEVQMNDWSTFLPCPYGQPGDQLWVRETTCIAPKFWSTPDPSSVKDYDGDYRQVSYNADGHCEDAMRDYKLKWTPSILVPRWASRITLEITAIRCERLQDISEEDAIAEGIEGGTSDDHFDDYWRDYGSRVGRFLIAARKSYQTLWESINGRGSWAENPFVWVVEFRRVEQ